MRSYRVPTFMALFCALVLSSASAFAQGTDTQAAGVPVTVTVTVLGSNGKPAPPIPKEDVTVHSGKDVLKVTGWEHPLAGNGTLQLALLIDENVRTTLLGGQLGDLANFIQSQAPKTLVAVYYAQHGSAYAAAPFSTDHAKAAAALHLTLGRAGESPSLYLSLADLAKHWPAKPGARREVLVIGSGNDPLNPGLEDPYADASIQEALKAGLTVHAIPVAGTRYDLSFRGNVSQGKLIELSEDTGGQTIGGETGAPVSLSPYLNQLNEILENQYLLTVVMKPTGKKKAELRDIDVKTEERDVKIFAPKQVVVPGS